MPGPNDYHVVLDGDTVTLEPGLGRDEPSEEQRLGVAKAGAARMQAMKDELAAAGNALSEKERAVIAREEAAIARERELKAREDALERQVRLQTANTGSRK